MAGGGFAAMSVFLCLLDLGVKPISKALIQRAVQAERSDGNANL